MPIYPTLPWHSMQLLHLVFKDLYWGKIKMAQWDASYSHHQVRRVRTHISTLVVIQVISPFTPPPSLTQSLHLRPDVKGNVLEGRRSPNNEGYTTSPNLILQQMAKCNLWPWQIAVLVKPPSSIRKCERNRQMRLRETELSADAEYKDGRYCTYLRGETVESRME